MATDDRTTIADFCTPAQYIVLQRVARLTDWKLETLLNQNGGANMTVCPWCRVDDFTHVEGCGLADDSDDE